MVFLNLALKSLKNRSLASILTVISIALSVILLLSVERAKRAAEDGFTQTISQTDLIVGARSGPTQLILYTVFNMGNATHNISYKTYQEIKDYPAIDWTIPYSLGDGHRGFRVVGTTNDFFEHYRFRGEGRVELVEGKTLDGLWDVVIGADVARKLQYHLGEKIVVAHGVTHGEGIQKHDDKPFTVVGIMKPTGTALDQSLYVSLEGVEAMHIDWKGGAAPVADTAISPDKIHKEDIKVDQITAFFVRTKSRIETLRLQREINNYKEEPLLAIIPGVTLSELWHGLSYVEQVLKVISWMVVAVGFMAMLIALTTSLNERRREMAILRALGAGTNKILALLVFESTLLTFTGIVFGTVIAVGVTALLRPWLEIEFGFYLEGSSFGKVEIIYLLFTLVGGILIGLIPAYRAQKMALKDGLSVKI
ncbi:MAG TPA: FtsX-like permease family protein [Pseudobdellovibrionaceae bacterium]|jgi:putative ABC transport system permease protein